VLHGAKVEVFGRGAELPREGAQAVVNFLHSIPFDLPVTASQKTGSPSLLTNWDLQAL
jgi:hypothetical protein